MAVFNIQIVANLIDNITSRARAVTASLALLRREASLLARSGDIVGARALRQQADTLDLIGKRAEIARYQLTTFGGAAGAALAAPLLAFNAVEQAFNRIANAADLALETPFGSEAFRQREQMMKGLLDLVSRIPTPVREVGEVMEDVMRAGIGETEHGFFDMQAVSDITERFIAAAKVFNINLKDTPKKMAVLAKLFGQDLNTEAGRNWLFELMDAIVWLDKNIPGTARNILEFLKRGAPDLKRLGFNEREIIALGALFESSVGKEAEQSVRTFASGMQRLSTLHLSGSTKGQRTRDNWARWLGFKNAKDFYKNIFEGKTGIESLIALIERLYSVPKDKRDAFIRNAMGLDPMRTLGAITPELLEELREIQKLLEDGRRHGALMREWERNLRSLESQWGLLRNAFTAIMGGPFGEGVADAFKDAMSWMRQFLHSARELAEKYPGISRDIGKWTAYLAAMLGFYFGAKMLVYVLRIMRLTRAIYGLGRALRFLARNPFMALFGGLLAGGALLADQKNVAKWLGETLLGIPAEDFESFINLWNQNALQRQFPGGQHDVLPPPSTKEKDEAGETKEQKTETGGSFWPEWLPRITEESPIEYFQRLFGQKQSAQPQAPALLPPDGVFSPGLDVPPKQNVENYYAPKNQVTAPITVNVTVNANFQNADPGAVGRAVGNAAAEQVKTALNSALSDGVQGYAVR